jgi:hypothetical protein
MAKEQLRVPWALILVPAVAMLGVAAMYLLSGSASTVGAWLFGLGLLLFFGAKVGLVWCLRRPGSGVSISIAQWRALSGAYSVSAGLLFAAGLLNSERPWSWFAAVGAAVLGWSYFVISRSVAGKEDAA